MSKWLRYWCDEASLETVQPCCKEEVKAQLVFEPSSSRAVMEGVCHGALRTIIATAEWRQSALITAPARDTYRLACRGVAYRNQRESCLEEHFTEALWERGTARRTRGREATRMGTVGSSAGGGHSALVSIFYDIF